MTTEPQKALTILARIIARAYIADCERDDEAKNRPEKKAGKLKADVEPSETGLMERLTTNPRDKIGE